MMQDHIIFLLLVLGLIWLISPLFWAIIFLLVESFKNPGEFFLADEQKMAKEMNDYFRKDWFYNLCVLPADLLTVLFTLGKRRRW